jgi:serine/threonine protein kinase
LGQVYKAKLRTTGEEVAVKVQRPDVLHQIALDMHLIREAAPILKRTFNLNTDLVDVVDKWGVGFVDELDYQQEGRNAVEFMESISKTPLVGVVIAPKFMEELSSGKVLVTKWVDGERLDKCTKSDVTALCSIAMNTYLTMMLETGVLHADPHPGNLLRTLDGKLCILDWGMVTRLDPYLQTTLVEHIAHLVSADYAEVPKDLLLLGFIEESKASAIEDSGIVEVLAEIYGAWTKGGGASAINVPKVVSQLQDLQEKKGNLFRIPSYFAYIAKSFSVLEGIGLSNDSSYSIIKECLPYVSKRLLTDDKLSGSALNIFLFGPEKNSRDRLIDFKRVEDLVEGFAEYSLTASGASLSSKVSRAEQIEKQSDLILDLLLVQNEETPLQKIFFEQLAKIISSSSRSLWSTLRERSGTLPSGRTVLGTMVDPLGIWRTSPLVRVNELDVKTIETTRNLIGLFQKQSQRISAIDASSLSNDEVIEISSSLVRKLWGRRFSLLKTGGRLSRQLLQMTADRLERGERDVMFLRPLNAVQSIQTDTMDEKNELKSYRLLEAARLLGEAEALEKAAETVSTTLD